MPAFTASQILSRLLWPGIMSLRELNTATRGFFISSSVRPSAFSRLRWGARATPTLTASLRSCIVSSFFLQALSLTQGMRSTEETSLSMPYHGRRRRCILTVAHGGVPRWPAAFSFAARGSFRSRPPQVLSPPACCGMGSFLLALSSHLLSDVDYTRRDPKCKGLSHFNAIK